MAYGRKMGWAVGAVTLLLTANNGLPYLGVRLDGCQTMFSGLVFTEASNNHLLIPQRTISDAGVYVVDVKGRCSRRPADTRLAVLCGWLENDRRAFHLEALRSAVHRLCAAGISVELAYRTEAEGGAPFRSADACGTVRLDPPRWWLPFRLFPPARPRQG